MFTLSMLEFVAAFSILNDPPPFFLIMGVTIILIHASNRFFRERPARTRSVRSVGKTMKIFPKL